LSIYTNAGFADKLAYETYCAGLAGCPVQYVVDGCANVDNLDYIMAYAFTYQGGGGPPIPPPPPPSGSFVIRAVDYQVLAGDAYLQYTGTGGNTFTLPALSTSITEGVLRYFVNSGTGNLNVVCNGSDTFVDGTNSVVVPPKGTAGYMAVPGVGETLFNWA
jgi:hypothetical protein